MKNKIGWCDMTWNPVWGCLNNCEYCYARGIARRFWKTIFDKEEQILGIMNNVTFFIQDKEYLKFKEGMKNFKPTFLNSQFDKKLPKKPQRIFVGSMSEIKYWKPEWIRDMLNKVLEYPQHTFQFLTKFPDVYLNWYFHPNCWLGITITDNSYNLLEYQKFKISNPNNLKFISFEPLLSEVSIDLDGIDWVIIGAETGNRKDKVIPNLDWVLNIVRYCEHNKIPVYIKDNLVKYYADCRGYKQFPVIK